HPLTTLVNDAHPVPYLGFPVGELTGQMGGVRDHSGTVHPATPKIHERHRATERCSVLSHLQDHPGDVLPFLLGVPRFGGPLGELSNRASQTVRYGLHHHGLDPSSSLPFPCNYTGMTVRCQPGGVIGSSTKWPAVTTLSRAPAIEKEPRGRAARPRVNDRPPTWPQSRHSLLIGNAALRISITMARRERHARPLRRPRSPTPITSPRSRRARP